MVGSAARSEATMRLTRSNFPGPVNIGSEEMGDIAGKRLEKVHVPGPTGVRGRNSDNRLIMEKLGWQPSLPLRTGLEKTYAWIGSQVMANR